MDSNDLFSDMEYSFRQTPSTLDYLNTQHQRLTQEHDIMALAFDIAKAFDRVWLNGWLKKSKKTVFVVVYMSLCGFF